MKITSILLFCSLSVWIFPQNNALHFDGDLDYVNINQVAPLLANDNTFTIEFWMKSEPGVQSQALFAFNNTNNNTNGLLLMIRESGQLGISDYLSWADYTGQTVINDGGCHHIAYTRHGSTASIYVDGVIQKTNETISADYQISENDFISIGQEWDGGPGTTSQYVVSNEYEGTIDEIRIWNSTRTASEIADQMNNSLNGDEANLIAYYNCDQGVASENNSVETTLINVTGNTDLNGGIMNFEMNGSISNFIEKTCDIIGINGSNDSNVPGQFQVAFPNV